MLKGAGSEMKGIKRVLIMILMTVLLCGNTLTVFAEPDNNNASNSDNSNNNNNSGSSSDQYASDEERDQVRGKLNRYYSDLKILYNLTDEKIKRMDKI